MNGSVYDIKVCIVRVTMLLHIECQNECHNECHNEYHNECHNECHNEWLSKAGDHSES